MNEDDRPARHPAVETAVFEPEVVIYDDRSGMVHHLNPSASSIWLLLDGRPLAAVIDALTQSTGMARDDLRRDVLQAVAELLDADLLSA
ncbi:MAG TPA: PqqD family protein [Acidimicrobiia bacterium]|nr:PqqD family protein [Acidimicrobiia bacterium]